MSTIVALILIAAVTFAAWVDRRQILRLLGDEWEQVARELGL